MFRAQIRSGFERRWCERATTKYNPPKWYKIVFSVIEDLTRFIRGTFCFIPLTFHKSWHKYIIPEWVQLSHGAFDLVFCSYTFLFISGSIPRDFTSFGQRHFFFLQQVGVVIETEYTYNIKERISSIHSWTLRAEQPYRSTRMRKKFRSCALRRQLTLNQCKIIPPTNLFGCLSNTTTKCLRWY